MTGSKAKLYNGIILLLTFFSCRLVWGIYQSAKLYQDIWRAFHTPTISVPEFKSPGGPERDIFRFSRGSEELALPIWLAWGYLGTNTILTLLNIYWFKLMISAVLKRFSRNEEVSRADKRDLAAFIVECGFMLMLGIGNKATKITTILTS
ncbi:hypothetical protein BELL_1704g00010 [Botrytis elliptica]|uniref:TLC domain-containing protein n=1 Tax=Botrytis elliptica TaxID=278938 RepID=A0A4Z1HS15_9HELO|nr:hypothetical protein BELL_1704g00010 [Botrytis elliptica]